jgi:hypothetical protein
LFDGVPDPVEPEEGLMGIVGPVEVLPPLLLPLEATVEIVEPDPVGCVGLPLPTPSFELPQPRNRTNPSADQVHKLNFIMTNALPPKETSKEHHETTSDNTLLMISRPQHCRPKCHSCRRGDAVRPAPTLPTGAATITPNPSGHDEAGRASCCECQGFVRGLATRRPDFGAESLHA